MRTTRLKDADARGGVIQKPSARPLFSSLRMRARLLLAFLLVGLLPPVFLFFAIHEVTQRHSAEMAHANLAQISAVQQRRINVELERMSEHLALVASRTQMRLSLRDYAASGAAVHVELIDRILSDALEAQPNIFGIWLRDADGALVTMVTKAGRRPATRVDPPYLHRGRPMQVTWDSDAAPQLWLQGPLTLDEREIGSIQLMMMLDEIRGVLHDFPHEQSGGKTFLVLAEQSGRVRVLDERLHYAGGHADTLAAHFNRNPDDAMAADQGYANGPVRIGDALIWVRPLDKAVGHVMVSLSMDAFDSELKQQQSVLLYLIGFAAILSIVMALLFARAMARPLEVLSQATQALQEGRGDVVIRDHFWGEFAEVVNSFNYAADMISRRTTALNKEVEARRASQKKLANLANTDVLTGLANRRYFMEVLDRWLHDPEESQRFGALLFLDLDGFKPVNDRLGHEAGDILLQVVAHRLRHLVRDQDQVARIGGDEFTLLLVDHGREPAEAEAVARRAEEQICMPINVNDQLVRVECSIGIVRLVAGSDAQAMMNMADKAMYRVKAQRRNRAGLLASE